MSGGMPQVAALSVTYLISFTSAAENALNNVQASFGVALRSLAAPIAFARFCASSRSLPNSCAQAGTCCGCPAHGDGAAWRCCCGGADHGDGAVCCGCCGHGAVADCCCCGHGDCAAAGLAVTKNMHAAIDATRRKFMANPRLPPVHYTGGRPAGGF